MTILKTPKLICFRRLGRLLLSGHYLHTHKNRAAKSSSGSEEHVNFIFCSVHSPSYADMRHSTVITGYPTSTESVHNNNNKYAPLKCSLPHAYRLRNSV